MRFVCDVMLGKLAKYLRLLGFDTAYARDSAALEHYRTHDRDRLFLTRRQKITGFPAAFRLTSELTHDQLKELRSLIRADADPRRALNRCIECNQTLMGVDRAEVESLVPEFVYHNYERFTKCPSCGRVYWAGSHTRGMDDLVKEIFGP
jgi:uncharacterized protein with PIN domain